MTSVSSNPFQAGSSVTSSLTPAQGLPARKGFLAWTPSGEVAERREDAIDGGGLSSNFGVSVEDSNGFEMAEEAGGDRFGPVVAVVSADFAREEVEEKIEVALFGGASIIALGPSFQLLVDPAPAGESVGVLAAEEGEKVAVSVAGHQLSGGVFLGGGFGLSGHDQTL
ncbi:MAG: hypothetical protein ACYC3I_16165 [Gemmataceae bacterium]